MLSQATPIANQPYQPYTGNLVAPLSQQQIYGINNSGYSNPFIAQANSAITNSTAPLLSQIPTYSAGQIQGNVAGGLGAIAGAGNGFGSIPTWQGQSTVNQYLNPYIGTVVGSTEQQLQNINEQQQQSLIGNAAASGAWGGDRAAVAQSVLAGQQAAQEAPTIANLYSQGFGQAEGEYNTQQAEALQQAGAEAQTALGQGQQLLGFGQGQQQTELGALEANAWLNSQAGFGLANLGNEASQQALNAGSIEQQEQQAQLNVPYETYLAEQAYPFQTTGWLANIAEGLGGAAGGSSSTTYPPPNALSEVAGLGLGTAGILGATGAFGTNGWMTGAAAANPWDNVAGTAFSARGGRIPHRAEGGAMPPMGFGIPIPGGMPASGGFASAPMSYVPSAPPAAGHSPIVNSFMNTGSTTQTSGGDASSAISDAAGLASLGKLMAPLFLRRGGIVRRDAGGALASPARTYLAMSRGLADGGSVPDALLGLGSADAEMTDPLAIPAAAPSQPPPAQPALAQPAIGQPLSMPVQQLLSGALKPADFDAVYGPGSAEAQLARHPGEPTFASQGVPADLWHSGGVGLGAPAFPPSLSALPPSGANAAPPTGFAGIPGLPGGQSGMGVQPPAHPAATGLGASDPAEPTFAAYAKANANADPADAAAALDRHITKTAQNLSQPETQTGERAGDLLRTGLGSTPAPMAPQSQIGLGSSFTPEVGTAARGHADNSPNMRIWLPMMMAGFGMMAGRSPFAGANIGQGALEGAKMYAQMPKIEQEQAQADLLKNRGNILKGMSGGETAGLGAPGMAGSGEGFGAAVAQPTSGLRGQPGTVYSPSGEPLFSLPALYQSANSLIRLGAIGGIPQLAAAGEQKLRLVQSLIEHGVVPTQNGGVMALPGYGEAEARKAAMVARAEMPAKVMEAAASRAGTPIKLTNPGEVVTTGAQAMPWLQHILNSAGVPVEQQGASPGQSGWLLHYASLVQGAENGTGNPAARNPRSTAQGNGQFINSTWLPLFKKSFPQVAGGMNDAQILQLRNDPRVAQAMTIQYAKQNAPLIGQAGFPVNNASLYLAHRFGPDGALKIMQAPENEPINKVVTPDVLQANPDLRGQTAGSLVERIAQRFGTEPIGAAAMPAQDMTHIGETLPGVSQNEPPSEIKQLPGGGVGMTSTWPFQEKMQQQAAKLPDDVEKLRNSQANLTALRDEIYQNVNGPAWLKSGPTAELRTSIAKNLNTAADMLGIKRPFDPSDVANNEAFTKSAMNASFSMAREMGSRVAVQEVQYAFKANPNLANTPYGNVLLSNLLLQQAQQRIDRDTFVYDAVRRGGDQMQAMRDFDAEHPADAYVNAARADAIKFYFPGYVNALREHPDKAGDFDAKFGKGAAELLLESQQ